MAPKGFRRVLNLIAPQGFRRILNLMVLKGFRRILNLVPVSLESVTLSDSRCIFFQSKQTNKTNNIYCYIIISATFLF